MKVEAEPQGARGLYFTDERIQVTFTLKNTLTKRLSGQIRVFYSYGASGTERSTSEVLTFDLGPNEQTSMTALGRLVGIQGNGVIGLAMPVSNESDVIQKDNDERRVLRVPSLDSTGHHILYTFTSMEREFYRRFYEGPEHIMQQTKDIAEQTKDLTKQMRNFTAGMTALAGVALAVALGSFLVALIALGKA